MSALSGVPGRIGAVFCQAIFLRRRAGALTVDHERSCPLIVVFGCVVGNPGIGQGATQQHVKMRRFLFGDRNAEDAGEGADGLG